MQEKIKELYGIHQPVKVIYRNMGKSRLGCATREESGELSITINSQIKDNEHIHNATLAHEFAHIVCFVRPELGKGHDEGWARVCRSLGGTGRRIENFCQSNLKPARRTRQFLYRNGEHEVVLTTIRHNKLQRGKVDYYTVNKTFRVYDKHFVQEVE